MNIIKKITGKINNKKISPKAQKIEEAKIAKIKEDIENIKAKALEDDRYSIFNSFAVKDMLNKTITSDDLKYVFDLVNEWDLKCNLSYEVGVSLNYLASKCSVYIHRTNLGIDKNYEGIPNNDALNSIMVNGLENHGHANAVGGSAFLNELPDLGLTMSYLGDLTGWINLIGSYKVNDTIIIAAFPKEYVDNNGIKRTDAKGVETKKYYEYIYDTSKLVPRIKTDYLVGAVIKGNNKLWQFHSRERIINNLYDKLNSNEEEKISKSKKR